MARLGHGKTWHLGTRQRQRRTRSGHRLTQASTSRFLRAGREQFYSVSIVTAPHTQLRSPLRPAISVQARTRLGVPGPRKCPSQMCASCLTRAGAPLNSATSARLVPAGTERSLAPRGLRGGSELQPSKAGQGVDSPECSTRTSL